MDRVDRMRETIALLTKTEGLFHRLLDRKVANTGVFPMQHRLLMELDRNPGRSQVELAAKFGISAAAIAVSLKKLEKGGYIIRKTDRRDNRANQVSITEKGKAVIRQSIRIFRKADSLFFEGFSDAEVEQLYDFLHRARENMKMAEQETDGIEKKDREAVKGEGK
ncbi:MAG TPA: MarR family transcriptional regulator [Candidatus Eisenbergiella merdipullorum]|uniref:MarR family transcriptional regulator n=1 Tax=Candidatus Eisenbergiella merdipullorum TaxID=2838553 RepID=A0A9D2L2A8_9FIRM|nr:MarR family transcriptional regulator [Candidatus Eisenbergiella merdipullorum]